MTLKICVFFLDRTHVFYFEQMDKQKNKQTNTNIEKKNLIIDFAAML